MPAYTIVLDSDRNRRMALDAVRKAEYARRQKALAERAAPLRRALVEICDRVLSQPAQSAESVTRTTSALKRARST